MQIMFKSKSNVEVPATCSMAKLVKLFEVATAIGTDNPDLFNTYEMAFNLFGADTADCGTRSVIVWRRRFAIFFKGEFYYSEF